MSSSNAVPNFHNCIPLQSRTYLLLQLLLRAELVGVSALLLAAVGCSWWEACVALSADHLVAVVLGGKGLERWLNDTTT